MTDTCPLCRAAPLETLEIGLPAAMRSDGLILPERLCKRSCPACGALIGCNSALPAAYRRSDGQAPQERARHARIAEGLAAQIARLKADGPILEIGAASFETALQLARLLPDAPITAVEPAPEHLPRTDAIRIHAGPLETLVPDAPFRLIYSNHVLEHVPDTRAFLAASAGLLAPDGVSLVACPNGLIPGHELLFADHLYHFTPRALACAAQDAGLALVESLPAPWEPLSLLHILVPAATAQPAMPDAPPGLTAPRRAYLEIWETAEARLLPILGTAPILFGAGEFSQLIRAYLPRVYDRIAAITLDDPTGARDFDRPVLPLAELDLRGRVVLAGVHPASVAPVSARLLALGAAKVLAVQGGEVR